MSFDVFFQSCRFLKSACESRNPFTGEVVSVPQTEKLTDAELKNVLAVVAKDTQSKDDQGLYAVTFSDGGSAEIFGDDLRTGCMVALRGISPDVLRFLYDLAKAGRWLMLPASELACAIVVSAEDVVNPPANYPRIVECGSPHELGILLSSGVEAWERYRLQVTKHDGSRCGEGNRRSLTSGYEEHYVIADFFFRPLR